MIMGPVRPVSGGLWRVAARRAAADWPLLGALFCVVLLATTVLAMSPLYAQASAQAGARRTLIAAPPRQSTVELSSRLTGADYGQVDEGASAALAVLDGEILRSGRSRSFALPGTGAEGVPDLTVCAYFDELAEHAELLDGAWPQDGGGVEAALSEPAAARLGLDVGDVLEVTSAERDALAVEVAVVGIYAVTDRGAAAWAGDNLELDGVERGQRTTVGPLVLARETFFRALGGRPATARWRSVPDFASLTTADVPALRRALDGLGERDGISVDTGLDELLSEVERDLLVSGPGVLIPALQLVLLAGYVLLACSRALAEQREPATALLRSRGADQRRLLVLTLVEAVALAVPAVAAGPVLGAWSLRLLADVGPLAAGEPGLDPRIGVAAYAFSALAGVVCVAVLAVPASSGETDLAARRRAGRAERSGPLRRAGADVALLAVAVLGYWQLRRYRLPLVERLEGSLGVDPFLAVAPALGLLAGAVIALRALSLAARVFQRRAGAASAIAPVLAAWQLARRPQRHARAALLVTLALAVGVFGVCGVATWLRSQQDQADYLTGGDLRVQADQAASRLPAAGLATAHETIPGVRRSLPVVRSATRVSRGTGPGQLLAVDAAQAAEVIRFRPDLSAQPLGRLLDRLVAARPAVPSVPLPTGSRGLLFDATLDLPAGEGRGGGAAPTVSVLLLDGDGLLSRVRLGELPGDGASRQLRATVEGDAETDAGKVVGPAQPLSLVGVELALGAPSSARTGRLSVRGLQAVGGAELPAISGWEATITGPLLANSQPTVTAGAGGDLDLQLTTGSWDEFTDGAVTLRATPGQVTSPGPLPALADATFLAVAQATVGDVVALGAGNGDIEVVGAVDAFPTLPSQQGGAVVVDLASLGIAQLAGAGALAQPQEWWLRVESESAGTGAAAALSAAPYSSQEVIDRFAQGRALRGGPIASASVGALTIAALAAGLLASIGFAVAAVPSARERGGDAAIMRALGLSPRQLAAWLWLENGLLGAFGLLAGTATGLAVARLVLPLVSLGAQARTVAPPVLLVVPWSGVFALQASVAVVVVAVTLAQIASARRAEVAVELRSGAVR